MYSMYRPSCRNPLARACAGPVFVKSTFRTVGTRCTHFFGKNPRPPPPLIQPIKTIVGFPIITQGPDLCLKSPQNSTGYPPTTERHPGSVVGGTIATPVSTGAKTVTSSTWDSAHHPQALTLETRPIPDIDVHHSCEKTDETPCTHRSSATRRCDSLIHLHGSRRWISLSAIRRWDSLILIRRWISLIHLIRSYMMDHARGQKKEDRRSGPLNSLS